jgi:hypothetical protein
MPKQFNIDHHPHQHHLLLLLPCRVGVRVCVFQEQVVAVDARNDPLSAIFFREIVEFAQWRTEPPNLSSGSRAMRTF